MRENSDCAKRVMYATVCHHEKRGCAAGRGPALVLGLEYFRVLSCSTKNLKQQNSCFQNFFWLLHVSDDAGLAGARPKFILPQRHFLELVLSQ